MQGVIHGEHKSMTAMAGRPGVNGHVYNVDVLFPRVLEGTVDTFGIDEDMASLLTGFIKATKPHAVLETGTHRGRSTRAIAEGLWSNNSGHLYTIDKDDYNIMKNGAIREHELEFVTQIVGETPAVFENEILKDLMGIDFAFIDGAHDRKGLEEDLLYVNAHRADECLVLVDNAMDEGWPDIKGLFESYKDYPHIAITTMCGLQIIQMGR